MRASRIAAGVVAAALIGAGAYLFLPPEVDNGAFGAFGDAAQPARGIEILIRERPDGRMYFLPDAIELRRGEQVRFSVKNESEKPHYLLVAPTTDITRAMAQLRGNPRGTLPAPNSVRVGPSESGEVFWHFTRAGELEFSSVLPGDREAGLYGRLVVR